MSFFHRKKKKEDDYFIYENLYDKVKIEDNELVDSDLKLDKSVIEEIYKEEMTINSEKDGQSYLENCCEQIAIASGRVEDAKHEYNIVGSYLNDILAIENAEKPFKDEINYYAKRIITLKEDKKSLKQDATKISEKRYGHIAAHEKEMPKILKEMQDDEQYCQSLKTDLHHIEGEKIALKYEKKNAAKKLLGIRSTVKILAAMLAASVVMLFIIQQVFSLDMLIPSLALVVIGAVIAAVIVVYNQNQEKELKIAEIKLNKAIALINKYKLKYVNVKSRLDYSYEVHGVKSSYELSELWRVYLVVKKEREAIHRASDEMYKSMESLIQVLDKLKLFDSSVWTTQVEALVEPKEMTEIRHTLNVRRQKLRSSIDFNMKNLEKYKEKIRQVIKDNPEIANEVIEIIEKYE